MRRLPVLAVLCLAGCEVATRDATVLQFLGDVEALIDARDRCGLYDLVTRRPGALSGSDPLAVEFRDFVSSARPVCRYGRPGSEDGGAAAFPDLGVLAGARDARGDRPVPQERTVPFLALTGLASADPDGPGVRSAEAAPGRDSSSPRPDDRADARKPASTQNRVSQMPASAAQHREPKGHADRGRASEAGTRGKSGRHEDRGKSGRGKAGHAKDGRGRRGD